MSNKQWPSDFACTLEHRQFNKQQRILNIVRTEPNSTILEKNRRRETEKEIGREGDMMGRKARQRG